MKTYTECFGGHDPFARLWGIAEDEPAYVMNNDLNYRDLPPIENFKPAIPMMSDPARCNVGGFVVGFSINDPHNIRHPNAKLDPGIITLSAGEKKRLTDMIPAEFCLAERMVLGRIRVCYSQAVSATKCSSTRRLPVRGQSLQTSRQNLHICLLHHDLGRCSSSGMRSSPTGRAERSLIYTLKSSGSDYWYGDRGGALALLDEMRPVNPLQYLMVFQDASDLINSPASSNSCWKTRRSRSIQKE